MTSSAKAAQQIAQEAAKQILIHDADHAFWGDKHTEDRIAAIIQQALSDSLRPYREQNEALQSRVAELEVALEACTNAFLSEDGHVTDPENREGWTNKNFYRAYMKAKAILDSKDSP